MLRSIWLYAQRSGAMGRRIPSVVSFLLAIKGIVDFAEGSHVSAALWIIGALLCIIAAQWWGFHDMRMEYERKVDEADSSGSQRKELLTALADALQGSYSDDKWKEICQRIGAIDAGYGAELEELTAHPFFMERPGKLRQIMREVRDGAHLTPTS